jgi:hypothetical protein
MYGLHHIKSLAGRDDKWIFIYVQLVTDKQSEIHRSVTLASQKKAMPSLRITPV